MIISSPRDISPLVPRTIGARAEAAGRWPFAFGTRFFIALLVGMVWLGPAWWDSRFAYGMLLWDAAVLLVWLRDLRRLPQPDSIEMMREWTGSLHLGEATEVRLRARNRSAVGINLVFYDDLAGSITPEPPTGEIDVPRGQMAEFSYPVRPASRGDFPSGSVLLQYQSGLRFAQKRAIADLKQTVRVYPSLRESKQYMLYLMRSRQIELEKRLKRTSGAGREFESLRDYREGDEPRDICWTAAARRAKLISRTYRMERSQQVAIVIDAGRLLQAKVQPGAVRHDSQTADPNARVTWAKLDYAVARH